MNLDLSLEEAMRTQRSIRRVKPDPVDDALVLHLLELALKAPSGGNRSPESRGVEHVRSDLEVLRPNPSNLPPDNLSPTPDVAHLATLRDGTLGKAFERYLTENDLDANLLKYDLV